MNFIVDNLLVASRRWNIKGNLKFLMKIAAAGVNKLCDSHFDFNCVGANRNYEVNN